MSIAQKAAINELREKLETQQRLIEELVKRIEKLEERKKPGPKPKAE